MRAWEKDLTILVTGTGKSSMQNLKDNLADWIFGTLDSREVKIIVPVLSNTGMHLKTFFQWAIPMGFEFIIVQTDNAPLTREVSALPADCFIRTPNDRDSLECAFSILSDAHIFGDETAFIMQYNPESIYKQGEDALSDREVIGDAKGYSWLTTLNLSEGLQDSFEGYETAEQIADREKKLDEFKAEQDRLNALAVESGVAPKKATTPRKRAAKKPVDPEPTPTPVEPEKTVQSVELPIDKLVAKRVEMENQKSPKSLGMGKGPADLSVSLEDEVAKEAPKTVDSVTVKKTDLIELGEHVKALTNAFSGFISTYTRIMEEPSNDR